VNDAVVCKISARQHASAAETAEALEHVTIET
jgi:hypothetical protein